jgi:hypothetical protein
MDPSSAPSQRHPFWLAEKRGRARVFPLGYGMEAYFWCFVVALMVLLPGEAVAPPVLSRLQAVLEADDRVAEIVEISTLHLGPRAILVALTLRFRPDLTIASLGEAIRELTEAMQEADGRVAYVYVRPG